MKRVVPVWGLGLLLLFPFPTDGMADPHPSSMQEGDDSVFRISARPRVVKDGFLLLDLEGESDLPEGTVLYLQVLPRKYVTMGVTQTLVSLPQVRETVALRVHVGKEGRFILKFKTREVQEFDVRGFNRSRPGESVGPAVFTVACASYHIDMLRKEISTALKAQDALISFLPELEPLQDLQPGGPEVDQRLARRLLKKGFSCNDVVKQWRAGAILSGVADMDFRVTSSIIRALRIMMGGELDIQGHIGVKDDPPSADGSEEESPSDEGEEGEETDSAEEGEEEGDASSGVVGETVGSLGGHEYSVGTWKWYLNRGRLLVLRETLLAMLIPMTHLLEEGIRLERDREWMLQQLAPFLEFSREIPGGGLAGVWSEYSLSKKYLETMSALEAMLRGEVEEEDSETESAEPTEGEKEAGEEREEEKRTPEDFVRLLKRMRGVIEGTSK